MTKRMQYRVAKSRGKCLLSRALWVWIGCCWMWAYAAGVTREQFLAPVPPGLQTGLALFNPSVRTRSVSLTLLDAQGRPRTEPGLVNPVELELTPGVQYPRYLHDLFGSGWNGAVSSVRLESTGDVFAFYQSHDSSLSRCDGINLLSQPASEFFVPVLGQADESHWVGLVNPSQAENTITLSWEGGEKEPSPPYSLVLPAHGCALLRLADIFPGSAGGYLRLSGSFPFTGSLAVDGADRLVVAGLMDPLKAAQRLMVPHYACGDGYGTALYLINPGSRPVSMAITAQPDGRSAAERLHATVILDPFTCRQFDVGQEWKLPPDQLASGYLVLGSDDLEGNIYAAAVIRHSGGSASVMPALTGPSRSAFFSHVAAGLGWVTGVTLVNAFADPTHVLMALYSEDGRQVAATEVDLAPFSRAAHLVTEFFDVEQHLGGFIRAESDGPVFTFMMFGRERGDLYSAVPPLPEGQDWPADGDDCSLGPFIDAVDPRAGPPGTLMTVYGRGFDPGHPERHWIGLGETALEFVSISAGLIVARVPDSARTGSVIVRMGECEAVGPVFTVTEAIRVTIQSPVDGAILVESPVTVAGVIAGPVVTVTVNGIDAVLDGTAFQAVVPLVPGANTLVARAISADGGSAEDSVIVQFHPPLDVRIDSPEDGAELFEPSVDVTGTVSTWADWVTVNGITAVMDNGVFRCPAVALVDGVNTITAVAGCLWATVAHTVTVQVDVSFGVTITAPPPNEWITELPVVVTGTCTPSVELVTVNGRPATLTDNRFAAAIALPEGYDRTITAVGERGAAATQAAVTVPVDLTEPRLSLQLPSTAVRGGVFTAWITVTDAVDVAEVALEVDGLPAQPDLPNQPSMIEPGFFARWSVPVVVPEDAPAELTFRLRAIDPAGHTAAITGSIPVVDPMATGAWLLGEVYSGDTGLPLDAARVSRLDKSSAAVTDARGGWALPVEPGPVTVRLDADGALPVFRAADSADGVGTVVLDARLAPRAVAVAVNASGGEVTADAGIARLIVPAGALAGPTDVSVTAVGDQCLTQLLSPGWAPWGALDVHPWDLVFQPAARLETRWKLPEAGRDWLLLRCDPSNGRWQRLEPLNLVAGPDGVAVDIDQGGQYLLAVADPPPTAPAPGPAVGEWLEPLAEELGERLAEGDGDVHPEAVPAGTGLVAMAELRVLGDVPLPSGTAVVAAFSQEYAQTSGATMQGRRYIQDVVLYRPADGATVGELRAAFPICPIEEFPPALLAEGRIDVDVMSRRESTAGVVLDGPASELIDERGNRIIFTTELPDGTWIDFHPLDPLDVPPPGDEALEPLAAFHLAASASLPPETRVELDAPAAAGDLLSLYRLIRRGPAIHYTYACPAERQGGRVVTLPALPGGTPAPGLVAGGDFVLCRLDRPPVFAVGFITRADGLPPPGTPDPALVISAATSVVAAPDAAGSYFLQTFADPGEMVDVTAFDDVVGAHTETVLTGPAPWGAVRLDLVLEPCRPAVVGTIPYNGQADVPVAAEIMITFDDVINSASVSALDFLIDGVPLTGVVSLRDDGRTVVATSAIPFVSGAAHTVIVGPEVANRWGRTMAAAHAFAFTTAAAAAGSGGAVTGVTITADPAAGTLTVSAPGCPIPPGGRLTVINQTTGEVRVFTGCTGGDLAVTITGSPYDEVRVIIETADGAQTVIRNPVITDTAGFHYVGPDGGTVAGPGGLILEIPTAALPYRVRLKTRLEAPTQPHWPIQGDLNYIGAVVLESDFSGKTAREIDVSFPVSGLADGDRCLLTRGTTAAGVAMHQVLGTATVRDGRLAHDCPPFSGLCVLQGSIGYYRYDPVQMAVVVGHVLAEIPNTLGQLEEKPVVGATVVFGPSCDQYGYTASTHEDGSFALIGWLAEPFPRVIAVDPETGWSGQAPATRILPGAFDWLGAYLPANGYSCRVYLSSEAGGEQVPPVVESLALKAANKSADGEFVLDTEWTDTVNRLHMIQQGLYLQVTLTVNEPLAEISVQIDDRQIQVDGNPAGGFSSEFQLMSILGAHRIRIVVKDLNGNSTARDEHVLVVASEATGNTQPISGADPQLIRVVPSPEYRFTSCHAMFELLFSEPVTLEACAPPSWQRIRIEEQGDAQASVPLDRIWLDSYPVGDQTYHAGVRLIPEEPLKPDTEYSLIIDGGSFLVDTEGRQARLIDTYTADGVCRIPFLTFKPQVVDEGQAGPPYSTLIQKLGPLVFVVADTGSENPWQRSELQIYDYSIASRGALRVRQPVPLHVLDLQVQPLDDKGEHLGVCLITTPGGLAFNSGLLFYAAATQDLLRGHPDALKLMGAATLTRPQTALSPARMRWLGDDVYIAVVNAGVFKFSLNRLIDATRDAAGRGLPPLAECLLPERGLNESVSENLPTPGLCMDLDVFDWPPGDGNTSGRSQRIVAVADSHNRDTRRSMLTFLEDDGRQDLETAPGCLAWVKLLAEVPGVPVARHVRVFAPSAYVDAQGDARRTPLVVSLNLSSQGQLTLNVFGLTIESQALNLIHLRTEPVPEGGLVDLAVGRAGVYLLAAGGMYRVQLSDFRDGQPVLSRRIAVDGLIPGRAVVDGGLIYTAPGCGQQGGVALVAMDLVPELVGMEWFADAHAPVYTLTVPVVKRPDVDDSQIILHQVPADIRFYYQVNPPQFTGQTESVVMTAQEAAFEFHQVDSAVPDLRCVLIPAGTAYQPRSLDRYCGLPPEKLPADFSGWVRLDGVSIMGQGSDQVLESPPVKVGFEELLRLKTHFLAYSIEAMPRELFEETGGIELREQVPPVCFIPNFPIRVLAARLYRSVDAAEIEIYQRPIGTVYNADALTKLQSVSIFPPGQMPDASVFADPGDYRFELEVEALNLMAGGEPVTDTFSGVLRVGYHSARSLSVGKTFVQGVDLSEGFLMHARQDLFLEDKGLDLALQRTWASGAFNPKGTAGPGWEMSSRIALVREDSENYIICGGDASGIRFRRINGRLVPQRGFHCQLTPNPDGSFDFYTKTRVRYHFRDPFSPLESGYLAGTTNIHFIEDLDGNRLTWIYDAVEPGLVRRIEHSSGNRIEFAYDEEDVFLGHRLREARLVNRDGQIGVTAAYAYDEPCRRLAEVRLTGAGGEAEPIVTEYRYGDDTDARRRHRLAEILGPNPDNRVQIEYLPDALFHSDGQRVARLRLGVDGAVAYAYAYELWGDDSLRRSRRTTVQDPEGHPTDYAFNDFGVPESIRRTVTMDPSEPGATEPVVSVTRMTWRTGARELLKESEELPDGRTVRHEYDAGGNEIRVTEHPAGAGAEPLVREFLYDEAFNRKILEITPAGAIHRWLLDERGRVTAVHEDVPAEAAQGLGKGLPAGLRSFSRLAHTFRRGDDCLDLQTRFHWDATGNLVETVDPRGGATRFENHDRHGRPSRTVDPTGRVTRREWNDWGECAYERGPQGREAHRSFDAYHRPVAVRVTDGLGGASTPDYLETTSYYPGGQVRTRVVEEIGNSFARLDEQVELDSLDRVRSRQVTFPHPVDVSPVVLRETSDYDRTGNLVARVETVTPDDGRPLHHAFFYDERGLEREHQVNGRIVRRQGWDLAGRKTWERDAAGRLRRFLYDGHGRLAWEIAGPVGPDDGAPAEPVARPPEADGRWARFWHYDAEGRVVAESDFAGGVTAYAYDALGRRIAVTNALGQVVESDYDPAGNLAEERDLTRGRWTRFRYDAAGRPLQKTIGTAGDALGDADGRDTYAWTYAYADGAGQWSEETNVQTGVRTRTLHDAHGRLHRREVDPDGLLLVTEVRYDAFGHRREETDPLGRRTRFWHAPTGWLVRTEDPEGFRIDQAFFRDGAVRRRAAQVDRDGDRVLLTEFQYDPVGRPVTERLRREADGQPAWTEEHRYEYSPFATGGDGVSWWTDTDAMGRVTRHEQDATGREFRTVFPENGGLPREERFGFDGGGRKVLEMNRRGVVSRYGYDALGRMTEFREAVEQRPAGGKAGAAQPAGGERPVRIDYLDHLLQRLEWDALDRPTRIVLDPLGREIAASRSAVDAALYDAATGYGGIIDAMTLWRRWYDSDNRLVVESDATDAAIRQAYDAAGRLIEKTTGLRLADPGSGATSETEATARWRYDFDAAGNLVREYSPRLDAKYGDGVHAAWTYFYNGRNEQVSAADADVLKTTTEYDGLGRRTAVVSPMGHRTLYGWDELSRLTGVVQGAEAGAAVTAATRYVYDLAGPVRFQIDAAGRVVERVYDPWDRMTEYRQWDRAAGEIPGLEAGRPTVPFAGAAWLSAYDAVGNLAAAADPAGRERTLAYDWRNRVTEESWTWPGADVAGLPDVPLAARYAYDDNDNLVRVAETAWVRPELADVGAGEDLSAEGPWRRVAYTTRYVHDTLDRVQEQTDGRWGTRTAFWYDRAGSRTGVGYPGEWSAPPPGQLPAAPPSAAYRYDAAYRLVGVTRHTADKRAAAEAAAATSVPDGAVGTADAGGDGASSDDDTGGDPDGDPEPGADLQNDRPGVSRHEAVPAAPQPLLPAGHRDPDGPPRRLVEPPASGLSSSGQNLTAALCPSWLRGDKSSTEIAAYTYFPDGLVESVTFANGVVTRYTYRDNGWVESIVTRTDAGDLVSRYEYDYDSDGNRIAMREWNATPARRAADPMWGAAARETRYDYDNLGRLVAVTYPAAGPDAQARRVAYTYDGAGNRLRELEQTLDGGGNPLRAIKDRAYHYTDQNQLAFVLDHLTPGRSVRYEYNAAGDTTARIIGELAPDGTVVDERLRLAFAWDAAGRLRQVRRIVAAAGGEPARDELMGEFCYDYAGRRVRKDGRFVCLGDGAGDPVPSDNRLYVYDGGAVLAEYAPDPDALLKARQYLYGTALLTAESSDPSPEPPAPSLVFYHLDPLGSTVNLTAGEDIPGGPAAGAVTAAYLYDAWGNYRELDITDPSLPGEPVWTATPDLDENGLYAWEYYLADIQTAFDPSLEPLASSLAWNRFTYTGHEFDPETGLYYFKARFYDPELGRFASADPYLGDALTPPSLHRYLYAYANPSLYIDLNGYQSQSTAEELAERYLKTRDRIGEITNWQQPGSDGSEIAGRAGSAAVKALQDPKNYGEAISQVWDVFKTVITRPGDVAGGLLTLPETVSRQLKEGLTQGYEQLRDWETLSSAARQQRVDTLVQQGVVTVLREGIIILTVKAAGRTVEITLREVDDTRWTISRMRTDRTEVILEREARPAVGPGRVTQAEPAALGRGAEAPAQSTGRRATAASAAEQATPPIRMRRIIVQDSAGKPVLRYEPEVTYNLASNNTTGILRFRHKIKTGKETDIASLNDEIARHVEGWNQIIAESGMIGLKRRLGIYSRHKGVIDRAGRKYTSSLGPAGEGKVWSHYPDMAGGGLPKSGVDLVNPADARLNSIIGGQINRLRREILAMPDDVTRLDFILDID